MPDADRNAPARFKSAHLHAGWENPSLIVACPECGSPQGHYCNDANGEPKDRPCDWRKIAARQARGLEDDGSHGAY